MNEFEFSVEELKGIQNYYYDEGHIAFGSRLDDVFNQAINVTHQRNILIEGIETAAKKLGIIKDESLIDGPMALMLIEDFVDCIKHLEYEVECMTEIFDK